MNKTVLRAKKAEAHAGTSHLWSENPLGLELLVTVPGDMKMFLAECNRTEIQIVSTSGHYSYSFVAKMKGGREIVNPTNMSVFDLNLFDTVRITRVMIASVPAA